MTEFIDNNVYRGCFYIDDLKNMYNKDNQFHSARYQISNDDIDAFLAIKDQDSSKSKSDENLENIITRDNKVLVSTITNSNDSLQFCKRSLCNKLKNKLLYEKFVKDASQSVSSDFGNLPPVEPEIRVTEQVRATKAGLVDAQSQSQQTSQTDLTDTDTREYINQQIALANQKENESMYKNPVVAMLGGIIITLVIGFMVYFFCCSAKRIGHSVGNEL